MVGKCCVETKPFGTLCRRDTMYWPKACKERYRGLKRRGGQHTGTARGYFDADVPIHTHRKNAEVFLRWQSEKIPGPRKKLWNHGLSHVGSWTSRYAYGGTWWSAGCKSKCPQWGGAHLFKVGEWFPIPSPLDTLQNKSFETEVYATSGS